MGSVALGDGGGGQDLDTARQELHVDMDGLSQHALAVLRLTGDLHSCLHLVICHQTQLRMSVTKILALHLLAVDHPLDGGGGEAVHGAAGVDVVIVVVDGVRPMYLQFSGWTCYYKVFSKTAQPIGTLMTQHNMHLNEAKDYFAKLTQNC